ncbi:poly-gamma-glutamate synthase PgsB [Anaeroselena agilis]|uniref:Poly-gamma-glutamate synthase PgsB n=1 Tax=Anaeroselena agilis TaxID=3063788 RepID=A0ABU3P1W4_9FIRM|nr:poly-gamma-glutamate synthase PgsB [Selenomonadales bacterium 4137-cl]
MTGFAGEYLAALAIFLLIVGYYAAERLRHEHNLGRIPLRIHVNGTRGKSSVARLIAAGLRAGGQTVVAKTTGSAARVILPDGSERPMARRGPANIRELVPFIAEAADLGAGAVVVECMAVRPELQRFVEEKLVKAHIGVITTVRPDHEEVTGGGPDVARALAGAIPRLGTLVTTPTAMAALTVAGVAPAGSVRLAAPEDVPPEDIAAFPYEAFPENVALALAVCELAGVDRAVALRGMRSARPDPGNVTVSEYAAADRTITLVNALAANDPESTSILWQRYADGRAPVILLNCRPDRKYRTVQLAAALAALHRGPYLVTGDGAFARRQLISQGVAAADIRVIARPASPADLAGAAGGGRLTIFATGNVQGLESFLDCRTAGVNS